MEELVRAKFTQNEELKALLLATGELVLEEGNTWHDTCWGVDAKTGEGQNYLGKILMKVRDELREVKMLNILEDYIWKSLPEEGDFYTDPNLTHKVNQAGEFLPFHGNTVVFDLSSDTKLALQGLQKELYQSAGWMLSQKLDPATFHMTLHDLVNGAELSEDRKSRMAMAEVKAKEILKRWERQSPLRMKTTWMFNMVNTSIVLGLSPADEDSWHRLDTMYTELESVVSLGYALTPHITMAYFKPGNYTQYDLNFLRQALHPVDVNVELSIENLVYQEFSDMNHYRTK